MPVSSHHTQLPLHLNAQDVSTVLFGGQVHVHQFVLLVYENKLGVLLRPHAYADGIVLMLLV
jgi:hypothetical protein